MEHVYAGRRATRVPLKETKRRHAGQTRVSKRARRAIVDCVESCTLVHKAVDTTQAIVNVPAAGTTVVCLNDLSQGAGTGNRIGNEIRCQKLLMKGFFDLPTQLAAGFDVARMTIVIDKECYGTACTYAQVYSKSDIVLSPFNFESRDRFVPIFDKTFVLQPTTWDSTTGKYGDSATSFSIEIPMTLKTVYTGNAGTISDLVKGSICVLCSSLYGNVNIQYEARVEYTSA